MPRMKWHENTRKREEEFIERNVSYLHVLSCSLSNPCMSFSPGLVEGEETSFPTSLDQLIGLCDELNTVFLKPSTKW